MRLPINPPSCLDYLRPDFPPGNPQAAALHANVSVGPIALHSWLRLPRVAELHVVMGVSEPQIHGRQAPNLDDLCVRCRLRGKYKTHNRVPPRPPSIPACPP